MPKITLVLHNIRSVYNVGSIFRTAEGFGVEKIILSGYTPYPKLINDSRLPHIYEKMTAQIHKTALGAEELVSFSHEADVSSWLKAYQNPIIALEQYVDSIPIAQFEPPDEFALMLGEEVDGIDQALLDLSSETVEIPMVGQKESFNVSVAVGIALYAMTN